MNHIIKMSKLLYKAKLLQLLGFIMLAVFEIILLFKCRQGSGFVIVLNTICSGPVLIALNMTIVGLAKGIAENRFLNKAVVFITFELFAYILTAFIPIFFYNDLLLSLLVIFEFICDLIAVIFIIQAIYEISERSNNKLLSNEAKSVSCMYQTFTSIAIISKILTICVRTNLCLSLIFSLFTILCSAISYILFIRLLRQTSH